MSSTIFFFLFIPLLAFILLAVNLIFAPHNPYMEKNSAFECGFSSFLGQNRTQFSISFFIFALLFLLFDLEILLVYPYLVSAYTNGVYGLVILLLFLLALTLGFAFELGKKALSIDSRQMSNVSTKSKSNNISNINPNISPYLNSNKRHYSSTSNNAKLELFIEIAILIDYLISLAILLVNCFKSPVSQLYSFISSQIKSTVLYRLTFTKYYIAFKNLYHEIGLLSLLDVLAIAIHDLFTDFIKDNVLNILCICLFCIYGVHVQFIPFLLFLLVVITILLFFFIIYIYKSKGIFKNPVVFWLCLTLLLILLFIALYFIFNIYILEAYHILTKGETNPGGPSGPGAGPGGPSGPGAGPAGPGGPSGPGAGPGGPSGPGGNNLPYSGPSKRKRGPYKRKSDQNNPDTPKPKRKDPAVRWRQEQMDPDSLPEYKQDEYSEGSLEQRRLDCWLYNEGFIKKKEFQAKKNKSSTKKPSGRGGTFTTWEGIEVNFTDSD